MSPSATTGPGYFRESPAATTKARNFWESPSAETRPRKFWEAPAATGKARHSWLLVNGMTELCLQVDQWRGMVRSEAARQELDSEIKNLVTRAYNDAARLLKVRQTQARTDKHKMCSSHSCAGFVSRGFSFEKVFPVESRSRCFSLLYVPFLLISTYVLEVLSLWVKRESDSIPRFRACLWNCILHRCVPSDLLAGAE